jgi:adenylate cyclase
MAAYALVVLAAVEAVALVVLCRRRVDTRNMLLSGGREAVKQVCRWSATP